MKNYFKMKNIFFSTLLLVLSTMLLSAQNNIDLSTLPNVADYIVTRTNPGADTVIIGLHGGPTDALMPGDWEYFENISTFSVVEMKQIQHLKPEIMTTSALTLDAAIIYNDTTVALLKKLVNHFNSLDKKVVLIGHSFGAFILPEYLDDYGIDDVMKVIPLSGRLNMNQEVVNSFASGYPAGFTDGVTVEIESTQATSDEWAGMKLQAGFGYNRFVDSLADVDLTKLMYVYGTNDQAVGRLLPVELALLESNNATILAIQGGSHSDAFETENISQVLDFIRDNQQVSVYKTNITAEVNLYPTLIDNSMTADVEKSGTLEIMRINGQLVLRQDLSSGTHQIELGHLSSGVYVTRYRTFDNEVAISQIVVE